MLLLVIIFIIILLLLCIIKKKSTNETWEYIDLDGGENIISFMDTLLTNEGIEYIVMGKSIIEMMFDKKPNIEVIIKNEDIDTVLTELYKYLDYIDIIEQNDDNFKLKLKNDNFIYKLKVHPVTESSKEEVIVVEDKYVDNLYKITKLMNYFLKKHGIPYWLIGALRNTPGGPIKWDDDVDVAIIKKHKKKLLKMMKYDKEFRNKIEYQSHNWGYQYRLKGDNSRIKKYYYDLFIYEKRDGKYGKKWYISDYPKCYYKNLDEIFPLKECNFWDLKLFCPNDLTTVQRGYEDNVLTHGFRYNHKRINSEKVDLLDCV